MTSFNRPDWTPQAEAGMRILVTGGSGGLGRAVIDMLLKSSDCIVGAHGATKEYPNAEDERVISLVQPFESEADCTALVDQFVEQAGGIDALVCLSGALHFSGHWKDMPEKDWQRDLDVNLSHPFFLSRAVMAHMQKQKSGGRIILNGTESAIHGGSAMSFAYAIAKRGTECMVEGLAREGASTGILVNGVRFGCIESGFHERWHNKSPEQMKERIDLIPLKRAGHPDEAAALIVYLLSGWAGFITGQMIPLTGGDWL
jgi:NAD(P)-dependent dehydrogenase (short-subunit alcohol dehydrogenase family)